MSYGVDDSPQVVANDRLHGLSALVSGAGSGIGRGIAVRLVELGAHVIGIGRRREALDETKRLSCDASRFESIACDVREHDAFRDAIDRTGRDWGLDLVVNNAGGQYFAPAAEISHKGWSSVIDLNLTAVFTACSAAFPYLARGRGSIVNISVSAVERGGIGMAHSISARAGVLGLTRSLALEWAQSGVRVNCLAPGSVETAGLLDEASAQVMNDVLTKGVPMQRQTSIAEIAELVAYLASPASAAVTGQVIYLDGGAHIGGGLHMLPGAYGS